MEKPTQSLIFKGSIPEAINESRRQKKLFVVYISGENENSVLMEQSTWVGQNVHETISRYCVFLHLSEGSVDASQFSSIYPHNAIPSISAIAGLNGVMLWHHEGYISAESLKENIEKSWASFQFQETAATLLATAALSTRNPSNSSQTGIQNSDDKTDHGNNNPICDKEAGPTQMDESPKKDDASSSKPHSDEITKTNNNNNIMTNNDNNNKNKNKAPIQTVEPPTKHDITLASSSKSDQTTTKETLNKTKQDQKQKSAPISPIEKSKSTEEKEKAVKKSKSNEKEKAAKKSTEEKEKAVEKSKSKSTEVCVSIKMLDGSSLIVNLTGSNALRSVRDFVDRNGNFVGFGSYDLAVPYPRKIFSEQDMERTLSDLGFSNREALIVIPHQSKRAKPSIHTNSTNREISNDINEGYFGYLRKIISYGNPFSYFGGSSEQPINQSTTTEPSFTQARSQQAGQSQTLVNSANRIGTSTGTSSRPFGSNIHMLRRDNEGENNNRNMFWNGNSTQFGGDNNNKK